MTLGFSRSLFLEGKCVNIKYVQQFNSAIEEKCKLNPIEQLLLTGQTAVVYG